MTEDDLIALEQESYRNIRICQEVRRLRLLVNQPQPTPPPSPPEPTPDPPSGTTVYDEITTYDGSVSYQ